MTQINWSRKDTLPHLIFWSAKNTHPVVRGFKFVWTNVWRLRSPMTFPANPKYFLLFMSSYELPLLSSGSPISSPSLMDPLSPGISCRVGFLSCRWENEIISSYISSSSSLTAASSCSRQCFFLMPQVQELCDYAGISSSIGKKISLATETQHNRRRIQITIHLWMWGKCCFSFWTLELDNMVCVLAPLTRTGTQLTTGIHPAYTAVAVGGKNQSKLHFCLSCSGRNSRVKGRRTRKTKWRLWQLWIPHVHNAVEVLECK